MRVGRFRQKGLMQLYEGRNAKGVPPAMADKLHRDGELAADLPL